VEEAQESGAATEAAAEHDDEAHVVGERREGDEPARVEPEDALARGGEVGEQPAVGEEAGAAEELSRRRPRGGRWAGR
jgi:hypothetical protein